jgi:hypothetical protein
MLVIKIELWPLGDQSQARLLGEGRICNEGGTFERGDYSVNLLKSPEYARSTNVGKSWRKGSVTGFPRRRLGPWDLLLRALVSAVGRRNPEAVSEASMLEIEGDQYD